MTVVPPVPTPIARRIGIDLHPIDPADRSASGWLEALVWPEQHERRNQLKLALEIASRQPIELCAGDASGRIGEVITRVSDDQLPCIFQTHVLNQFSDDARLRLFQALEHASEHRPLVFISREAQLTLDLYHRGKPQRLVLANTDIHGKWMQWLHDPRAGV